MRINNKILVRISTGVLLLFACFYMYDFYKCLSGFIANGFREPMVMLPMILAFFLPVLCFFVFFYGFYVRKLRRSTEVCLTVLVAVYAAAVLALILSNLGVYVSNNSLGVYDTLPSIFVHFPYDMIIILGAIFVTRIMKLKSLCTKPSRLGAAMSELNQRGSVHVGCAEYVWICVPAVFALVFTGASVCALFNAFENVFFDIRYVFLLVWTLAVPLGNIILITLKPEKMSLKKSTKLAVLGTGIGVNLAFAALFAICELTYPDFLVHMGKPMFLIAFSVSMPIEPLIIFIIMTVGTALMTAGLIRTAKR